jgi:methanethiol S-methyltransferase
MRRILALAFGTLSYLIFLATFLYAVGFVGNWLVPKSIDSGRSGPLAEALLVDTLFLGLFAVPHSVMARPGFKRWWTRIVPTPVERSTYVLTSSLLLCLLFWQWRPISGVLWDVANPLGRGALNAAFWVGWGLVLLATFAIDHFDLFGVRQVYLYASGRVYTPVAFKAGGLQRYVRHPIMLGFLIAFWATPTMTVGHLLFAAATTVYILVGIRLEERDLIDVHGEPYEAYRRRVWMLLPFPKNRKP